MAVKPDAWMPLYFGAYLSDTMHLTTEQHGAYLLLMMAAWKQGGPLPDDDAQLAAIAKLTAARWKTVRLVIAPFWTIVNGRWRQKRLGVELAKARGIIEQRSGAGKASAKSRETYKKTRSERMIAARAFGTHTEDEWEELKAEFLDLCVRCGCGDMRVEKDHIKPVYQGGSDAITNIQPLCAPCNASKGSESKNWVEHRRAFGFEDNGEHDERATGRQREFNDRATNGQRNGRPSPSPKRPSPLPSQETLEPSPSPSQERSKTYARAKRAAIRPADVSEKVWDDFMEVRKAKRAPLTDTALNGIVREADKAGLTLQAALEVSCARGWQGFEAAWMKGSKPTGNAAAFAEAKRKLFGEERDVTDEADRI